MSTVVETELDAFYDRTERETYYLIERESAKTRWYVIRAEGRDMLGYSSAEKARERFKRLKVQAQIE